MFENIKNKLWILIYFDLFIVILKFKKKIYWMQIVQMISLIKNINNVM